jgi:hypothetical protein
MKTKIVSCHTADSKPVKEEVNGTVILPPLVFPRLANAVSGCSKNKKSLTTVLEQSISLDIYGCIDNSNALLMKKYSACFTSIVTQLGHVLSVAIIRTLSQACLQISKKHQFGQGIIIKRVVSYNQA